MRPIHLSLLFCLLGASAGVPSLRAQTRRNGPYNTGYTTVDIGGGNRVQFPNSNPSIPAGAGANFPKPDGKIFRTPSSEKTISAYQEDRQELKKRLEYNRRKLRGKPINLTSASRKNLARMRATRNGNLITADGILTAEHPTGSGTTPGIKTAPKPEPGVVLTPREQARQEALSGFAAHEADRVHRQRLMAEALARLKSIKAGVRPPGTVGSPGSAGPTINGVRYGMYAPKPRKVSLRQP